MNSQFKLEQKAQTFPRVTISRILLFLVLTLLYPALYSAIAKNAVWSQPLQDFRPASVGQSAANQLEKQNQAAKTFQNLPLYFEQNEGQWAADVLFQTRKDNLILRATTTGLALNLLTPPTKNGYLPVVNEFEPTVTAGAVSYRQLLMKPVNSQPVLRAEGLEIIPGKASYFLGNQATAHYTDVNLYNKLVYPQVYPGIDQIIYGNQAGQLQYDFVVAPFADPAQINLKFAGAEKVEVNKDSTELVIKIAGVTVYQHSLFVYQKLDGGKQPVKANFLIASDNTVRFELGDYNRALPLIIDPVLAYSSYFGRLQSDGINSVATDSQGNLIFVGSTVSADLPVTPNAFQAAYNPGNGGAVGSDRDSFIVKLNPNLTGAAQLLYVSYFGGSSMDRITNLLVDAQDNLLLAGSTSSPDLPVTANAFQSKPGTLFLVKLNPNLVGAAQLIYSSYFGDLGPSGHKTDDITKIVLDNSGNIVISGSSYWDSLPVTSGAFQAAPRGYLDGFVLKININLPKQAQILYCTYFGGAQGGEKFNSLAVDNAGNIILGGYSASTDTPVTVNAFQSRLRGLGDGLIVKLNPALTGQAQLIYSTYFGSDGYETLFDLALDEANQIVIAGTTNSSSFPVTANAFQTTIQGNDGFITKLDITQPASAQLLYSTFLGGKWADSIQFMALDETGNIIVSGTTYSPDFPVTGRPIQKNYKGELDLFVTKLNLKLPGYRQLIYSTYFGGLGLEAIRNMTLDRFGNVLFGGETTSVDLPVSPNAFQPANSEGKNSGVFEGYLVKIALTEETWLELKQSSQLGGIGQPVTFTATLLPTTAGGNIVFSFDGTISTTVALSGGVAEYITTTLPVGSHTVKASYPGQGIFEAVSSTELQHAVANLYLVTQDTDDGTGTVVGTFSYALAQIAATAQPGLIKFNLSQLGNMVKLGSPLTPDVPLNTAIDGEAGVIINGNGVSGAGLRLRGYATLKNLVIRGFAGQEIVSNSKGNQFIRLTIG